ncbi:histone deacetylase [Actinomadura parmotrematis]|uniref:Histone deacetylase n=1 Tax=Actinomadura parmotrematis TaxID=2864039 RepID=A0ABS7FYI1_9ACTN|nr:histone deacetylase [Actinomadura parmotrematis]MBW8485504.1 histone deacetylase [Actinomadura parmotrematis]
MTPGLLWYVAYGSNLYRERFACYLAGGTPPGGAWRYPGCRDAAPARDDRAVLLPGGIYFAHTSLTWGGGMAFYDPGLPGRAPARAYLLTAAQFCDVMAQEMRRRVDAHDPGTDRDLSEVLATGRQRLGPGRYETLLKVGERDGRPMLTFTAPHPAAEAPLNAPSAPYLTMLGRGLAEAHGWDADRAAAYLAARPGARRNWTHRRIADLLGVVSPP